MVFPQYISTKNRTTEVVGYIDLEKSHTPVNGPVKYIPNKGYIDDNGIIWIYSSIGRPVRANEYPYFWLDSNNKKDFSSPPPDIVGLYNEQNLYDLSKDNTINITKEGEVLFNEAELNDMNAAADVYVPTEKEKDDFLKKIIKRSIIEKGINTARLKSKTGKKNYVVSNMITALEGDTKMSVTYFGIWCELLGLDFQIGVTDSGTDLISPLKKSVIYDSSKDAIVKEDDE